MQLSDVAQVKQVLGEDDANQALAEGWKLIAVVTANASISSSGRSNSSSVTYVLGRPAYEEEWDGEEPAMPIMGGV